MTAVSVLGIWSRNLGKEKRAKVNALMTEFLRHVFRMNTDSATFHSPCKEKIVYEYGSSVQF